MEHGITQPDMSDIVSAASDQPTDFSANANSVRTVAEAMFKNPAVFAYVASRGEWQNARHLMFLSKIILYTIHTAGRLIISLPVRHGKSTFAAKWMPAWWVITNPQKPIIIAANSQPLALDHSEDVRRIVKEWGPSLTGVTVSPYTGAKDHWRTADLRDTPTGGGIRAVGRGGTPEGFGASGLIIDDPYRSLDDVSSPTVRRMVERWILASLLPRLEPQAWAILILSRWIEEDIAAVLVEHGWNHLVLPAIAGDNDPLGRKPGEPLWPERWPLQELEKRRQEMIRSDGEWVWNARWQQNPQTPEGGWFNPTQWRMAEQEPPGLVKVRAWDLAASPTGDWTVGVMLGTENWENWYVTHVVRFRGGPDDVRKLIRQTADMDGPGIPIVIPQDPGQAGVDQREQLKKLLADRDVRFEKQTGSKTTRAAGWSAVQRSGYVHIFNIPNITEFCACHHTFPYGKHDDDVDAAATAYNWLNRRQPMKPDFSGIYELMLG